MAITYADRSRLLARFIGLAMVVLSILAVTTDADCEPDRWKYYLAYRYYASQKALGCGKGDASPGHLARKRYLGLSLRNAEAQAEDDCSASQFSGIHCAGYIMNKTRSPADGATEDWTADLYRDQLPPEGLVYPCDSSSFTDIVSHTVVGLVRETVRECYSASAVAASSYCNSIIVKAAPATTVFATSTVRVSVCRSL